MKVMATIRHEDPETHDRLKRWLDLQIAKRTAFSKITEMLTSGAWRDEVRYSRSAKVLRLTKGGAR
jgi:hypothetical protein